MSWIIQILDLNTNKYVDYISAVPSNINNYLHIRASYFGSSTRQGSIGTFYYLETKDILPLSIRILNNKREYVKDIILTKDMIESIIFNNSTFYKTNEIIIYYRDLHRFENYPYEISGIAIKNN